MQEQQSDLFEGVSIDLQAKQTLSSIVSWAMIAVVTAVVGYILTFIELFTKPSVTVRSEGFGNYFKIGGEEVVITVISAVIGLLMNFFLYRFVTQSKTALTAHSEEQLTAGFKSLKIYFAIGTIVLIVIMLAVLIIFAATL